MPTMSVIVKGALLVREAFLLEDVEYAAWKFVHFQCYFQSIGPPHYSTLLHDIFFSSSPVSLLFLSHTLNRSLSLSLSFSLSLSVTLSHKIKDASSLFLLAHLLKVLNHLPYANFNSL